MAHQGWVGVDLDGSLAYYDGFKGDDHIGHPIQPMVDRVKEWLAEGKDVRLFTARRPSPEIRRWMKQHLGVVLPITSTKDKDTIAIYDDRAVGIKRNTGEPFHKDNETQVWRK